MNIFKRFVLLFAVSVLIFSCNDENKELCFDISAGQTAFHVETQTLEKGYGYIVAVNGKKIISQTLIPSVEGNHKFKTREDALKVGRLVALKMIQSTDFPSVTEEEIKELNIVVE